jgi:hypothetical protein
MSSEFSTLGIDAREKPLKILRHGGGQVDHAHGFLGARDGNNKKTREKK